MWSTVYSSEIVMKPEFLNWFSKYSWTSNFIRIHPVGDKLFYTDSWMERQIRQK